MSDKIIKGGVVVTAADVFQADIRLEGELIAEIGLDLNRPGAEIIPASGLLVLPGGVDVHTCFNLTVGRHKVSDGWYHGTLAALMGGTTTVVEHPGFAPTGSSLFQQLDTFQKAAQGQAFCDYGLHGVLQPGSPDLAGELPQLAEAGYYSVKAYTTYEGRLDDEIMLEAFRAFHQGVVAVHAENDAIVNFCTARFELANVREASCYPLSRPPYAESEAVTRAVALANTAQGAQLYIVNVSSRMALKNIEYARKYGQKIWAETCPQYLLLNDSLYATGSFADALTMVMAPPLRKPQDNTALWRALAEGDIEVVATAHRSFSLADKMKLANNNIFKAPSGVPGVETRLPLIFSEGVLKGRLSLPQLAAVTATNPARIMGLSGKGSITVGKDADLVLFDPRKEKTISVSTLHQKVDYTPFEGFRIRGWPEKIFLRGSLVVDKEELCVKKPFGRFVKRFHNGAP